MLQVCVPDSRLSSASHNPARSGKSVVVDGHSLSIAAVTAAARYSAQVEVDPSPAVADRVGRSRDVIAQKVAAGTSVYGLTTGFGGSGTCLT